MNLELVIESVVEKRPAYTLRRTMPANMPSATLEWALRWETEMRQRSTLEKLLQARPVAKEGVEVTARHVFKEGVLAPQEFRMQAKRPFEVDWRVQPWMPMLVACCDGKGSVSQLFTLAKKNDWIHPETPELEFCGVVATLISGGFLEAEGFTWPGAAE